MIEHKLLYRIFIFCITFFGYSMLHAMRSSWSYSKNQLSALNIVNKTQSGYVDMIFLVCYSLGLGLIGPLGDKINRRYFIAGGYLICSICFMVFPFSCKVFGQYNIWILFVFMGINGLFESVGMPGSMGVLHNWFSKKNRGAVVGLWAGCCNWGNTFGLISATIIHQYINAVWEWNFFFNGILSCCMAILILIFLIPSPDNKRQFLTQYTETPSMIIQAEDQQTHTIQKKELKVTYFTSFLIPRVPEYVIAYSCLKSSIYGLLFWLPKYINYEKMASSTGYIPSMNEVGTFFGGALIGYLGDRLPITLFLAPAMYFSATMMLGVHFFLHSNPAPYYIVIFLMGLGLGGPYNVIGTVISIDLGTDKTLKGDKKAISTVTAVIDSVGAIFSALTQIILAYLDINLIFYLFAAYTYLGALALTPMMIKDFRMMKIQAKDDMLSQKLNEGDSKQQKIQG